MNIGHNNTVRFESMADLASYMTPSMCLTGDYPLDWIGGLSPSEAIHKLTTGDHSRIAAAEALMAKFDLRIETPGQEIGVEVAGFYPSVPDYLGGPPECMFSMVDAPASMAPLKIIVNTLSSAAVDAEEMAVRGTTILAAVMALSAIRPVSLEIICVLDCGSAHRNNCDPGSKLSIIRVPINSAPIDLGSACYALCSSAVPRRILYGLSRTLFQSPLQWPEIEGVSMMNTRSDATIDATIRALGEDPDNTLFVPGICSLDSTVTDPALWVETVLAKYGHQPSH